MRCDAADESAWMETVADELQAHEIGRECLQPAARLSRAVWPGLRHGQAEQAGFANGLFGVPIVEREPGDRVIAARALLREQRGVVADAIAARFERAGDEGDLHAVRGTALNSTTSAPGSSS